MKLFTLSAQGGTLPEASLFYALAFLEQLRDSSGHDYYTIHIHCHADGSSCEINVPRVHSAIESGEWASEVRQAENAINQGVLFLVSKR